METPINSDTQTTETQPEETKETKTKSKYNNDVERREAILKSKRDYYHRHNDTFKLKSSRRYYQKCLLKPNITDEKKSRYEERLQEIEKQLNNSEEK